ncbi:MAG: hypothetical protein RL367_1270 [Pseudomonadota bacterium]
MNRRKPFIPQRMPIFVGCEGQSERGYIAFLGRLAGSAVHLEAVVLQPGGGDPLSLVEKAIGKLEQKVRTRGIRYTARLILLDADKRGLKPKRDARALQLAKDEGILLVWQEPCHEALLLRHLDGRQNSRPPDTQTAIGQLKQQWRNYEKGMTVSQLEELLDLDAVRRASAVEPGLAKLLKVAGLI